VPQRPAKIALDSFQLRLPEKDVSEIVQPISRSALGEQLIEAGHQHASASLRGAQGSNDVPNWLSNIPRLRVVVLFDLFIAEQICRQELQDIITLLLIGKG
jgi:hypothetical protein